MSNLKIYSMQARKALEKGETFWTAHVDDLDEWKGCKPETRMWITTAAHICNSASQISTFAQEIIVAISLEPKFDKFDFEGSSNNIEIDFFAPPAIYFLNSILEYPASAELYELDATQNLKDYLPFPGRAVIVSRLSEEAKRNGWEFDQTLYLISKIAS